MSSNSSKQNVIVINSSHYLPTGSGNKFVYRFSPSVAFSSNDRIGVQSLSIFNSFFNISDTYGNNTFQFTFPCFNPNTGSSAVFQAYIGNSVQFQGQITNPTNIEITGSTISQTSTFTGFIGGTKTAITSGYITGNQLKITSGTPALSIGMWLNGSSTRIVSGSNALGWMLSDSALSPTGSLQSPSTTIFATTAGNILWITSTPSATVPSSGVALTNTIYVQASGFSSQTITNLSIGQVSPASVTLTSSTPIYLSTRNFSAGLGTSTFSGTGDGVVYPGMAFTVNGTSYIISNPIVSGTSLTLSLSGIAGIFPGTSISNVSVPSNAFSILTVSGSPIGNGIFLPGSTMTLSGAGISSNVQVLDQISSSGSLTGVAGVYKVSYNSNTPVQTIYANDSVSNNTNLYVSSVSSGSIIPNMQFQIAGQTITINSLVSPGIYSISSSSGTIPSIYPQQISASTNFSNSITLNVTIPNGYYDASTLNYFLQNVCIANNCYLTDAAGSGINTYFFEILQNSTYYGFQINVYPLPKVLPSTLAYPSGASWTLLNDGNNYTPVLTIGSGLQKYFGFSNNIISKTSGQIAIDSSNGFMNIPASVTTLQNSQTSLYLSNSATVVKTYTFISDVCPIIHTVNSLVMDCNLITSKFNTDRSNTFFSIPMSASFGNLITVGPFPPCLCSIYGGIYQQIELSFYDTNGSPVNVRDSDATITLVLSVENDIQPHTQRM